MLSNAPRSASIKPRTSYMKSDKIQMPRRERSEKDLTARLLILKVGENVLAGVVSLAAAGVVAGWMLSSACASGEACDAARVNSPELSLASMSDSWLACCQTRTGPRC